MRKTIAIALSFIVCLGSVQADFVDDVQSKFQRYQVEYTQSFTSQNGFKTIRKFKESCDLPRSYRTETTDEEVSISKGKNVAVTTRYAGFQNQDFYFSVTPLPNNGIKGGVAATRGYFQVPQYYPVCGFATMGHIQESKFATLKDLFGTGKTFQKTAETIRSVECEKRVASNQFGTFELWLQPNMNYVPQQFRITKKADDYLDDMIKVSEKLAKRTTSDGRKMDVFVKNMITTFYVDSLLKVEGLNIPQKYRIERNYTYTDASKIDVVEYIHITSIRTIPPSQPVDTNVNVNIPNGTQVTVAGEESIEYEWRDGKIVKKVSAKAVEQVAAVQFQPPENGFSRWLWVIGPVGVASLVAGVLWWRRRGRVST